MAISLEKGKKNRGKALDMAGSGRKRNAKATTYLFDETHNLNLGVAVLENAQTFLLVQQIKHLATVNLKEADVDGQFLRPWRVLEEGANG